MCIAVVLLLYYLLDTDTDSEHWYWLLTTWYDIDTWLNIDITLTPDTGYMILATGTDTSFDIWHMDIDI